MLTKRIRQELTIQRRPCRFLNVYTDDSGSVRVLVHRASWQDYLDRALAEILLYGRSSLHVMRRLRTLIIDLEQTVAIQFRPALTAYRLRIEDAFDNGFSAPEDRAAARRLPPATECGRTF